MASQTMSMRVSDDVQELFKSATQASGLKQEEFLVTLLTHYSKHAESEETANMTQEKAQVRASLEKIRTLIEAVIDRAGDETHQAQDDIKIKTEEFNLKLNDLQAEIKRKGEAMSLIIDENSKLKEDQESRYMLKQAYGEKLESADQQIESLQSRIKTLEKTAKEKEQLSKKVAEHENTIRDMELNFQKKINKIMESENKKLQDFILTYQGKKS